MGGGAHSSQLWVSLESLAQLARADVEAPYHPEGTWEGPDRLLKGDAIVTLGNNTLFPQAQSGRYKWLITISRRHHPV